ncbi:PPM-type phosphatase domain-containing protein [Entamoeba marina]
MFSRSTHTFISNCLNPYSQKTDKKLLRLFRSTFQSKNEGNLPKTMFLRPNLNFKFLHAFIPDEEPPQETYYIHYSKNFSNVCFSTYPVLNGQKFGKPIADCSQIDIYKDIAILSIADGCGIGKRPRASATIACKKFAEYIISEVPKQKILKDVVGVIVDSLAYVQTEILSSVDNPLDAGLTTFLGCVILKTGTKYAICYVNIGDCRAIIIDDNQIASELINNYQGRVDIRTTGGKLGPVNHEEPELDNFECGITFCSENSILILMTDGICDNFDIKTFCEDPKECGLSGDEWCDSDIEHWNKRKELFYYSLNGLFLNSSLSEFCMRVYRFICQKTVQCRKFVNQKNENVKGKMDHSTFSVLKLDDSLFFLQELTKQQLIIPDDMFV